MLNIINCVFHALLEDVYMFYFEEIKAPLWKQDWKSVQRCATEGWKFKKNDQTDHWPDKYSHPIEYERGGARTFKHAKLPISSFYQSVSEWLTIISTRDAGASENRITDILNATKKGINLYINGINLSRSRLSIAISASKDLPRTLFDL